MIKVLFICLGNICRSPMAEFLLKDIVKKRGLQDKFLIESAATIDEEIGNPVYYKVKEKLSSIGISIDGKFARKLKKDDYTKFDYILGMEDSNIRSIIRITGGDNENKVHRLLDFSNNPRDIADPYFTRNFDITYNDILDGLNSFLEYLEKNNKI